MSSDERGHFELRDIGADVEALLASAPGYLPARHALRQGGAQGWDNASPVTVMLESGGVEVFGSVLDATGGPIPSAAVMIRSTGAAPASALVQSDSNGEFSASAPEGEVEILAVAEAYSQATRRVHAPARGVTLVLAPSAEAIGRVVDAETGEPIAGVRVFAHAVPADLETSPSAISERDGAFRVVGLSGAMPYEIGAISTEWRSNVAWVRLDVGQQSEPIVLRASRATTLTGTVLVAGEPCRGAFVVASGPVGAAAHAAANGSVHFEGLPPGRYHVVIECPQALSHSDDVDVADEPVSRAWAVAPGLSIDGRVENSRGEAVPAAEVSVISVDGGHARGGTSCVTAANGRFTCSGLTPGVYDCSVDQDRDSNKEVLRISVAEGASAPVLLRTRPSGTIRVSVRGSGTAWRSSRVLARGENLLTIEAQSDQNGFVFSSLPLGRYDVYSDAGEAPRSVHLERDGQVSELQVDIPDAALSIQGRVLDEDELPIADAWVSATRSDLGVFSSPDDSRTLTDEHGNFALHELAPGSYRLHVWTAIGEGEASASAGSATRVMIHVQAQM